MFSNTVHPFVLIILPLSLKFSSNIAKNLFLSASTTSPPTTTTTMSSTTVTTATTTPTNNNNKNINNDNHHNHHHYNQYHIDYAERIVEFITDNNVIKVDSNYKVHSQVYLYMGEREFMTKTTAIVQRNNN